MGRSFIDVETTGLSVGRGHRLFELSALIDAPTGQRLLSWTTSDDDGVAFARDLSRALETTVVVGHNVTFDLTFLADWFRRQSLELPTLTAVDTLALSRRLNPRLRSHALSDLARHYRIVSPDDALKSARDVRLTRAVFHSLLAQLPSPEPSLLDVGAFRVGWHG